MLLNAVSIRLLLRIFPGSRHNRTRNVLESKAFMKRSIVYYLLRKKYKAKNKHTPFTRLYFRYECETDVNNVMKKIKYVFKNCCSSQLLF